MRLAMDEKDFIFFMTNWLMISKVSEYFFMMIEG